MRSLNVRPHHGFYIAIAVSIAAEALVLPFARDVALEAGLCVFFFTYLAIVLPIAIRLNAEYLRRRADDQDPPAVFIFVTMLATAALSAAALLLVMIGDHSAGLRLGLSTLAVILGWFTVHTMMAMHYAFEFYGSPPKGKTPRRPDGAVGGLEFSGPEDPDGISFLYFSFVVGMTAQTSDTAVSSNAMRRLVAIHGIFAFFFNTVIIAAAVNLVVALAH